VRYLLADEKPGHITTLLAGRSIELLYPCIADIFIEDIACSLAKLNRFNGYTSRVYTVAEHCLLGLDYLPAWERFEFLMHDATEAYLGDVSGPLKALDGMGFYRDLEERWRLAIAERFGLKKKTPGGVKVTDQRMLVTEMRDLRGRRPLWGDKVKPFPQHLSAKETSAELLEQRFLEVFAHLSSQTQGARR